MKFFELFFIFSLKLYAAPAELRLHANAQSSLTARIASLDGVSSQLDIETFYLENDRLGRGLLKQILQLKEQRPHVQVRLLLDAWGSSGINQNMGCELISAGIPTRFFNPKGGVLNQQRTHRKIWLAGNTAFVGGRNLSEENFSVGSKNSMQVLSDWDVELRGPVLQNIQKAFNQGWGAASSPECKSVSTTWIQEIRSEKSIDRSASEAPWIKADVEFFADPVGDNRSRPVRTEVAKLIRSTRSTLEVENAFFMPVGPIMEALGEAQKKKLQIEFYLNGPDINSWMAKYSSCLPLNEIQWWMDNGAFVAFTPKDQRTHAKSIFADGKTLAIGSFNFDSRSINTNAETMLMIREAPEIFAAYSEAHRRRMQDGIVTKQTSEVFEKYGISESAAQDCANLSSLKPLLKNFF